MITRRTAVFMFAVPAIVRATSLMPVRAYAETFTDVGNELFLSQDFGNRDRCAVFIKHVSVPVPHFEMIEVGPQPSNPDLMRLIIKYRYPYVPPRAARGTLTERLEGAYDET